MAITKTIGADVHIGARVWILARGWWRIGVITGRSPTWIDAQTTDIRGRPITVRTPADSPLWIAIQMPPANLPGIKEKTSRVSAAAKSYWNRKIHPGQPK